MGELSRYSYKMDSEIKPMHKSKHFPIDQLVCVGNYELEKTIGTGNFAVVKLATHVITKTKVRTSSLRSIISVDLVVYLRVLTLLKCKTGPSVSQCGFVCVYKAVKRWFFPLYTPRSVRLSQQT